MYGTLKPCRHMTGTVEIQAPEYVSIINSRYEAVEHSHRFIEIVYFQAGQVTHSINGQQYSIQSGDIYLINAGVKHSYTVKQTEKPVFVKNCIFDAVKISPDIRHEHFIEDCYAYLFHKEFPQESADFLRVNGDYNKDFFNLFQLIENELKSKNEYYSEMTDLALRAILYKIFRGSATQTQASFLSASNLEIMEEAVDYVKKNYNRNLSLVDLAQRFNFSCNYFNLIFKKYTSLTFKKFVQKVRCEAACNLLKTTDMTIESISEAVGYLDTKQFFLIFKRNVGVQPGVYRKKSAPPPPEN